MKKFYLSIVVVLLIISGFLLTKKSNFKENIKSQLIEGIIIEKENNTLSILDNIGNIYKIKTNNNDNLGNYVKIKKIVNEDKILSYEKEEEKDIPEDYLHNGLFKEYIIPAYDKLKTMSLDEKISQTLIVHHPTNDIEIQEKYQFGGYIFFAKDFQNKSQDDVIKMISDLQNCSKIPLITAIDEEGGKVSRISSNPNLVKEPFKSPQELYSLGGFDAIKEDTINKSKILKELGLNVNLAPVVDVSTNENDYIYGRSLGQDTNLTSQYAQNVILASKNTGVTYTLKHFPGYSNNLDTHKGSSLDTKPLEKIKEEDIPPFKAGIEAGAQIVMISHNIVFAMDKNNPASLSKNVHDFLRNDLNFTGLIITDDLNMQALNNIDNIEIKALQAGNNLLITSNYEKSFNNIKNGINSKLIDEEELNKVVFQILSFKYANHLL